MYIEIHNYEEFTQKMIYFKLNNSFNMDLESETNHKIAGVYAIYKDEICLYVGQSKNIASRLATHMMGKYKDFTDIFVWNIEDIGFSDFKDRDKNVKDNILINTEKWLITKLKPIENIIADMSFALPKDKIHEIYFDELSSFTVSKDVYILIIYDTYSYQIDDLIMEINRSHFNKEISDLCYHNLKPIITKYNDIGFHKKGVKDD